MYSIAGRSYDAVALDFDGVVFDSAEIKERVFREVLPADEGIHAYLSANQGRPRDEKFEFVWTTILGREYTPEAARDLHERFARRLEVCLERTTLVSGAETFIRAVSAKAHLSIVSAAPADDIVKILCEYNIRHCFDEIHGNVVDKSRELSLLASKNSASRRLVFFGDTISDFHAAQEAGVAFVAVGRALAPVSAPILVAHINTFEDLEPLSPP